MKGEATRARRSGRPSFFAGKKLLLVAPHADDETAGGGGTLLRAKEEGAKTFVLVLSVGDLPHYAQGLKVTPGRTREAELARACEVLRVDGWEVVFREDDLYMKLDSLPRQTLMQAIERGARLSIQKVKPDVVLLPHPSSHQDHEAVFRAALSALRPHDPSRFHLPGWVLVYEAPQAGWSETPFSPNFFVDISPYLAEKKRAFLCHRSQQTKHPHPFAWSNIERLAALRGALSGYEAAEGFELLRGRV